MRGFHQSFVCLVALGLLHYMAPGAAAQFSNFPNFWTNAGEGDWNAGGNWSEGGVPDVGNFDEYAVISNGGTAFLNTTPSSSPGAIVLGQNADETGTLRIESGGHLSVVPGGGNQGQVIVGQQGTGTLRAESGGSLSASSMTFSGSSTFEAGIAGASAPQLSATGAVNLGGTLELDFGGSLPTPGTSWNLFDVGDFNGQFSQINLTNGSLGLGQRFTFREIEDAGSTNGVFGQLAFEQLLALEVNRDSGEIKITNPSADVPVQFDIYSITSGSASFNPANGVWNSLQDQNNPGWIEANPRPTILSELDTSGVTTLNGGQSLSLGTPWHPQATSFGQNLEDLVFEYASPTGEMVSAPVIYTGANVNDLTLIVDPVTGQAQLRNTSEFPVAIEGYAVTSASGSLDPTNWDSLENNPNASDWIEANPLPDGTAVAELKVAGAEGLLFNEGYDLGELFDPGGDQDLVFEYFLAGQSDDEGQLGTVIYGSISDLPPPLEGLFGDYNDDGSVDAADYTVWRDALGTDTALPNDANPGAVSPSDHAVWKFNFGATASGAGAVAAAVPEPASWLLGLAGLIAAAGYFRRIRS